MLSTSSFATSPSSLSSSSSSAAVSRFVPNPRGLLCHRQERTMSINIYNKHAQTKREREKPIGKKTVSRETQTQKHSQTRLPLLKTRYRRLRKSLLPHLPPLSASTSSFVRGEKETETETGESVTPTTPTKKQSHSFSLILFKLFVLNTF